MLLFYSRSTWFRKLSCYFFISAFVATSVAGELRAQAVTPAASQGSTELWESRVFIDRCPTRIGLPEPAFVPWVVSILTFLIPRAIDFGVSLVNQHLQTKKKEEEAKNNPRNTSAVGIADAFYQVREDDKGQPTVDFSLKDKCLIFLRGNFSQQPATPPNNDCASFSAPAHKRSETCKWLNSKGIFATSGSYRGVGVYLESKFVMSDDGTSFRLQPTYFSFSHPVGAEAGDDGKYDLTFTVNFESASAGQSITPFGLGIIGFQKLGTSTFLDAQALEGKSSGWTPVLSLSQPQVVELTHIKDVYAARDSTKKSLADLELALTSLEARTQRALAELTGPAPTSQNSGTFERASDEVKKKRADAAFDDVLAAAKLDAEKETGPTITAEALAAAKRRVDRQLKIREHLPLQTRVTELNSLVEEWARKIAEKAQVAATLKQKEDELTAWRATWTKGSRPIGPATIRVGLTEQPYRPTNVLLLTLADAFAASKGELAQLLSLNATQALGLDKEAQLTRARAVAQQEIVVLRAKDVVKAAQEAMGKLPADASDETKRTPQLALDIARINADTECKELEKLDPAAYQRRCG